MLDYYKLKKTSAWQGPYRPQPKHHYSKAFAYIGFVILMAYLLIGAH